MHIEAVNNIKNKITDITLRSVEEVAVTEFNNDKSNNIFDEFVKKYSKEVRTRVFPKNKNFLYGK